MHSTLTSVVSAIADLRGPFEVGASGLDGLDVLVRETVGSDPARVFRAALALLAEPLPRGGSVVHENGFRKISLYRDPVSQMQLRLNFWPAGTADASIHDHRWAFSSHVLVGRLDHAIFTSAPSDAEDALVMVDLSDADAALRKTESGARRVAVRETHRSTLSAGSAYALDADTLHTVRSARDAVTLMVTGPPVRDFTRVVRLTDRAGTRRGLTQEEARDHLEQYAALPSR